MKIKGLNIASILSLASAILILVNVLLVAYNGKPIVVSSYPASNLTEIQAKDAPPWGRIAFGISGLVEGPLIAFWIILAAALLAIAVQVLRKQEMHGLTALATIVLSILSVTTGGGFVLGLLLGVIGGAMMIEGSKPIEKTIVYSMIKGALLSRKLYNRIKEEPTTLRNAAIVVTLVALISGLGNSLYTFNVKMIKEGTVTQASTILLQGQFYWSNSIVISAINQIGVTFLRWLFLALAIYIVGVRLSGASSGFDKTIRVVAFAIVPICFEALLPLMFWNEPTLTFQWPLTIFVLTRIWVIIALTVAVRELLDISILKSLGIVILGSTIYWLFDTTILMPTLNPPGLQIVLLPMTSPFILLLITCSALLATLLGAFSPTE